jgi:hypothetical protein
MEVVMSKLTDFTKGIIAGFILAIFILGIIHVIRHLHKRNKELTNYAEKQIEIENLQEDINNRSADEFLEIPDVRRAADGARDEFDRKRNEILERYRSQYAD